MPVILKWLAPIGLIRVGCGVYGNNDFLSQTISGATQVQVELDPVYPATGVGAFPAPQVTITGLPGGTQGNLTNVTLLGAGPSKILQFTIGDNAAEQAGGLNQLDITAAGNESIPASKKKHLAQSCTLRVYYYRAPNPTTTTTPPPSTTTTTPLPTTTTPPPTTTTVTPASRPVKKRARAK